MRYAIACVLLCFLSLSAVTDDAEAAKLGRPNQSSRFASLIAAHAKANGISLALANAVVAIESRYNPRATGSAGEIGLMQIKLRTARGVGYRGSAKGLYDPETNLRYGMKYLGQAQKLARGDLCGTIMKYNGGHYLKRPTRGTRAYCGKARQYMAMT